MPKSKHRKKQKQKSRARTARINSEKRSLDKKMRAEFEKYMEELQKKSMEIEEVDVTPKVEE
tara:strand:- start:212 stop:397 length:186 start_codon:yes stop_codon:yes gene_type:complete